MKKLSVSLIIVLGWTLILLSRVAVLELSVYQATTQPKTLTKIGGGLMKVRLLLTLILIVQITPASFSQQPSSPPPPTPVLQPQKPEDVDVVRITSNLVQV